MGESPGRAGLWRFTIPVALSLAALGVATASALAPQGPPESFRALFNPGSIPNRYPFLVWPLVVEGLSFAALPLTLALLRPLPDGGYALAKSLGLLATVYIAWLGASVDLWPFLRLSIVAAALLVAAAGAWTAVITWPQIIGFFRRRWPLAALTEALFLAAFAAVYVLRLFNAELWDGEKFLDMAFLTAVARSNDFPVYDPWFAGADINYYYFGHFIFGSLTKLTGILPEVAFNLAAATVPALAVAVAFSLGFNLVAAAGGRLRAAMAAGLLTVLLVAVVGSLDGIAQIIGSVGRESPWRVELPFPPLEGAVNFLGGLGSALQGRPIEFDYWHSTHLLFWPSHLVITEFPFFSFLFADLHAHVIAIPLELTFIALALGLVLSASNGERARPVAMLGAMALVLGALRWTSGWSFPTYLALGALACGAAALAGRGLHRSNLCPYGLETRSNLSPYGLETWRRLAIAVLAAGAMLALAIVLFMPFQRTQEQYFDSFQPTPFRTQISWYLLQFGLFLFVAVSFLWACLRKQSGLRMWLAAGLAVTALALLALANLVGLATAALAVLLGLGVLVALWRELKGTARGPQLFVLGLLGLAMAVSLGVELVVVEGDYDRLNTVFKFWLNTWVLLSVAAPYGVWFILRAWPGPGGLGKSGRAIPLRGSPGPGGLGKTVWSLWVASLALLLAGALVYPPLAVPQRLGQRLAQSSATINGLAYMKTAVFADQEVGPLPTADDYAAVQWLRYQVEGLPTVIEGTGGIYVWGGRMAAYTGLPSLLGWLFIAQGHHLGRMAGIEQRWGAVEELYTTADGERAWAIACDYRASYIVAGRYEGQKYSREGLAKLQDMEGRGLALAFQQGETRIYRVLC